MAAYTKAVGQISNWQALDDTTSDAPSSSSAEISCTTELATGIIVTVAHKDTNDAASNYVTVKLLGKMGSNDEDWKVISERQCGGGQAATEALNAESASGQKEIQVADTTDWDTGLGERLLLYNVGTPANSEVVTMDFWDDADHYTVIENLTNTHDNGDGDALYDGVDVLKMTIPPWVGTAKVTVHNSDGDATYLWRVDYGEVQTIA